MDGLKRQRAALKGQITRIIAFIDSPPFTTNEAKVRLDRLNLCMQKFEHIQDEIEALTESADQISEENQYRTEFENNFYSVHAQLSDAIDDQKSFEPSSKLKIDFGKALQSLTENQNTLSEIVKDLSRERGAVNISRPEVRNCLPKIILPEFSGDFDDWIRFRDLFEALVISKETVSGIEKLEYLQTHLKDNALSIIKHISPSNENFEVAWNLIKDHYDKPSFIKNAHLDKLFDQPVLKSGSLTEVKRLFSTSSENINALRALKQPIDSWDALLVYVLTKKLDVDNKMLWLRETKDKPEPTYSDLSGFLKQRINELECLSPTTSVRDRVQPANNRRPFSKDHVKRVLNVTMPSCPKCNQKHFLYQCAQFRDLSVSARCDFVKLNKICQNCLRAKHNVADCKYTHCRICKIKHNTILHCDQLSPPNEVQPSTSDGTASASTFSVNTVQQSFNDYLTMLPTALVHVKNSVGEHTTCRVLLDSGSQTTLISEACLKRLGLKRDHAKIPIVGLGQSGNVQSTKGKVKLEVSSLLNKGTLISVPAFVLSQLTKDLPSVKIPHSSLSFFNDLPLADPSCNLPNKIDILFGADAFFEILTEGRIVHPSGNPIAQNTIFGWVIAGNVLLKHEPTISVCHSTIDLDLLLKRFFEHEDTSKEKLSSDREVSEFVENHFKSTHFQRPDGRFVVSLPFNKDLVQLGDSRSSAVKRLLAMERRFTKDPTLRREYCNFMREYEQLGHMTLLSHGESSSSSFYLPHHAVHKLSSTSTKLRVVFDASCKSSNGLSLNDYLCIGPTIQNDLTTCLIKFRKFKVAVKADIAKMYRQVLINENDTNFQRIVWRNDVSQEIRDYKLQTVTYGTASASYLATRVLKQIGINNIAKYPWAADSLINDFYVDDYMSTFHTIEDAIRVKNELCCILKNSGMDLRKWSSNSSLFINTIDPKYRETGTELPIGEEEIKTLGLIWDAKLDCFKFQPTVGGIRPQITKREVLSDIARIFDPLGWLSPSVIKMKIFMKRLWLNGIGWDTSIPMSFHEEWSDFRSDLDSLREIRIPRWLHSTRKEVIELHGFADASESAYAAAVYSRVVGANAIRTALICAKTRIAPVKPALSIPRLELCGSLLLTKLLTKVKNALCIHDVECFAYTDSTTVLHWIYGYPKPKNTYVDNRISQIVGSFPATIWHFVRSGENPADCATRGLMPKKLPGLHLWWNGPHFLREETINFSSIPFSTDTEETAKNNELSCLITSSTENNCKWNVFEKFSNLNLMYRTIARCVRLFKSYKPTEDYVLSRFIVPDEIRYAKIILIRHSQRAFFQDEIQCLEKGNVLSTKNKYSFMNPFIDNEGVMRVGGRLDNADIPFEQKHPIILHKNHRLSRLIVDDCHSRNMHAGKRQMTYLVSLEYFIVGVHHLIKRCIYQCTTCVRERAIPYQQQMASLPRNRLNSGITFGNTGVDFAGPFLVRSWKGRGPKQYKVYVSLFVCMSTKALHLEVVTELSSAAFIAALRRFVARRGKCHTIFSDNGTNFVGANQRLHEWAELLRSNTFLEDVTGELSSHGIKWCFSPPHAPHFGGLWEAGVKTLKFHIRRVLGNTSATYEEFTTILCQIEACANSRPLCLRFEGDTNPLTPAHFLIARPMKTVPDPCDISRKTSLVDRWQYLQQLVHEFWRKWSQDYITQLRKRPKWLNKCKNIKIDDVVLIKDENQPPCRWLMGRVSNIYPGQDGMIRVVSVVTSKGEFKRPICKLCPLLIDDG